MYLFDLDGTLIDSNGIWAEVDRTFLARRGYPYTKEYYEGVAHTIFPSPPCSPRNTAISPKARMRSWRSGWSWRRTTTPTSRSSPMCASI